MARICKRVVARRVWLVGILLSPLLFYNYFVGCNSCYCCEWINATTCWGRGCDIIVREWPSDRKQVCIVGVSSGCGL